MDNRDIPDILSALILTVPVSNSRRLAWRQSLHLRKYSAFSWPNILRVFFYLNILSPLLVIVKAHAGYAQAGNGERPRLD